MVKQSLGAIKHETRIMVSLLDLAGKLQMICKTYLMWGTS